MLRLFQSGSSGILCDSIFNMSSTNLQCLDLRVKSLMQYNSLSSRGAISCASATKMPFFYIFFFHKETRHEASLLTNCALFTQIQIHRTHVIYKRKIARRAYGIQDGVANSYPVMRTIDI